jgi:hypothetical protein
MRKVPYIALLLCLFLAGCGATVGVAPDTLAVLNKAIDAIYAQPTAWRDALNDAVDHLADKTTAVAKQVQTLLNDSVAFVGVEARCNLDFLGMRIRDSLIYIRDKILLNKPSIQKPTPWVCHFSPDALDVHWDAQQNRWIATNRIVRVFGFNFSYAGLPKVELRDANGQFIRSANVTPTYSTTYELLLNFQPEGFQGIGQSFSAYLQWGNQADPNGLPAIKQPPPDPPCPFGTASVQSSTITFRKITYGFIYHIDSPVVTQHTTSYPMIVFMAGERVKIHAEGCVQTGGSGATWKLYVNPQGNNSDRLYHGLISIPSTKAGLVRIQSVNDQTFQVGSLQPGGDTLTIGYEDDDYSDNGYYGHDDGTGNQCLGVGNASIDLTVQLSVPT